MCSCEYLREKTKGKTPTKSCTTIVVCSLGFLLKHRKRHSTRAQQEKRRRRRTEISFQQKQQTGKKITNFWKFIFNENSSSRRKSKIQLKGSPRSAFQQYVDLFMCSFRDKKKIKKEIEEEIHIEIKEIKFFFFFLIKKKKQKKNPKKNN